MTYAGVSREATFAEVFLREPAVDLIAMTEIRARRLTRLRVHRPMTTVALHGPGLARVGVSAVATTGDDYLLSRRLALEIWRRPQANDGLTYRARHDDGELSVAIFDRAADALEVVDSAHLEDDAQWLASLAVRYGFDFAP